MSNKKGLTNEIMMVLVLFLVLLAVMAMVWLASTVGPLIVGQGKAIGGILRTASTTTQDSAIINATQTATSFSDNILGTVELLVYFIIIGLFIGFLILAYFTRTYHWMAFVWPLLMVIVVILSMFLSNAYETTKLDANLNSFYTTWGTNDFLMSNLPYLMTAIGFIGGILLFIIVIRTPEEEATTEL